MKITIYTEQEVEYYGGEMRYVFQPSDEAVFAAGVGDKREWCVVEYPWQGEPSVASWHTSLSAAVTAARKYARSFARANPGGYGWEWKPGKCNYAAAAMGRKGGSAKTDKKAASSRENGKKGGRPVEKKTYWILSGEGENGTQETKL